MTAERLRRHGLSTLEARSALAERVAESCVLVRSFPQTNVDDEFPVLRGLFPDLFSLNPPGLWSQEREFRGSGFVVKGNMIVTNDHVAVAGGKHPKLTVGFTKRVGAEGRLKCTTRSARIILRDPEHDLAILKVDGRLPVPSLSVGDSNAIHAEDEVLVMKNRYRSGEYASSGVVKARGPLKLPNEGGICVPDMIATEALVHRGDSGGPVVNSFGHVIGVLEAADIGEDAHSGPLGFAVPSGYLETLLQKAARLSKRYGAV